jgi:hypothetical protein
MKQSQGTTMRSAVSSSQFPSRSMCPMAWSSSCMAGGSRRPNITSAGSTSNQSRNFPRLQKTMATDETICQQRDENTSADFATFRQKLIGAAHQNHSIRAFRCDERVADLWRDEAIERNPPLRVEFEHAIVFGTFAEALSMRRSKSGWGDLKGLEPLRDDDLLHPTRIVYQLKASSKIRQRWEVRDTFRNILGKDRCLVGEAMRLPKKRFLENLLIPQRQLIHSKLRLRPDEFWRAVRNGDRFGPNGIHRFVKDLTEQTEGYEFNFPDK